MDKENLILAIHLALGGNGWAYSNWEQEELVTQRPQLEAVADLLRMNNTMTIVKEIKMTCEACPSQWEGITDDNRQVYVRYRWGRLSVRLGQPGDHEEFAGVWGDEIFTYQSINDLDGIMEYEELKQLTASVIQWPKTCGREKCNV